MNVLIAMDSFKGALSSERAGKALERGILRTSGHQTTVCSEADGGEGSVHALAACVRRNTGHGNAGMPFINE